MTDTPSVAVLPAGGKGLSLTHTQKIPRKLLAKQPGTSFPLSPLDGQEYVYYAAAGVLWRFLYSATDAAWSGTGPPLYNEVQTAQTTTSTTYTNLSTTGPAITLPFAGDYDVEIGALIGDRATPQEAWMSYQIGATTAADADAVTVYQGSAANVQASVSRRRRKTGLGAVTLTAKYRVDGDTGDFTYRWMAVWPVKYTP